MQWPDDDGYAQSYANGDGEFYWVDTFFLHGTSASGYFHRGQGYTIRGWEKVA